MESSWGVIFINYVADDRHIHVSRGLAQKNRLFFPLLQGGGDHSMFDHTCSCSWVPSLAGRDGTARRHPGAAENVNMFCSSEVSLNPESKSSFRPGPA